MNKREREGGERERARVWDRLVAPSIPTRTVDVWKRLRPGTGPGIRPGRDARDLKDIWTVFCRVALTLSLSPSLSLAPSRSLSLSIARSLALPPPPPSQLHGHGLACNSPCIRIKYGQGSECGPHLMPSTQPQRTHGSPRFRLAAKLEPFLPNAK